METLKHIIEYTSIIISVIFLIQLGKGILKIFQQSHYHLTSYKKIIKHYYLQKQSVLFLPIVIFIFFLNYWYIQLIYCIYLLFIVILKYKEKDIIKLKITQRIKRIFYVILVVDTSFATLVLYFIGLVELVAALALLVILSPFLIFICSLITHPIEYWISKYYQFKAKRKLFKYQTKIIGITGSFGKTSTKNILFSLLKNKYITLVTEKSYNTLNGVSKNINELLTSDYEYMIVEMGANRVNDIQKLFNLVNPTYGIVTAVGKQHLETFKSIDNILVEKMKLIDMLPDDGIGVINYSNEYIRNYNIKSKCKIIKVGYDVDCDYWAYDIKQDINGIYFKLKFKDEIIEVNTRLLGIHNVFNIIASIALAIELNVDIKDILFEINNLEAVKNRLNIESVDQLTVINDAFNSNSEGFKNALEVLSYYQTNKILITPGIVDGGKEEEKINYELGKYIVETCDFVVLIENKSSEYIKKSLDDLGYKNYIIFEKFVDAFNYVKGEYPKATVLIENDINDFYKI